jgi:hypothetical protein
MVKTTKDTEIASIGGAKLVLQEAQRRLVIQYKVKNRKPDGFRPVITDYHPTTEDIRPFLDKATAWSLDDLTTYTADADAGVHNTEKALNRAFIRMEGGCDGFPKLAPDFAGEPVSKSELQTYYDGLYPKS